MKAILFEIDNTISLLKQKGDSLGYEFEDVKLILCLEIIRLELAQHLIISDINLGAFFAITGWSYHVYRGMSEIQNDIHKSILAINNQLYNYTTNEYLGDLESPTGNDIEEWKIYFKDAVSVLLNQSFPKK